MKEYAIEATATEMARRFGDYLARVRFGAQTITILKNKKPVAELRPLPEAGGTLEDFVRLWKSLPTDSSFADDLEKVNQADAPLENPWA